jgi:hypothetical protein
METNLWNDGMTKGNTICPRPFHGGGIKILLSFLKEAYKLAMLHYQHTLHEVLMTADVKS